MYLPLPSFSFSLSSFCSKFSDSPFSYLTVLSVSHAIKIVEKNWKGKNFPWKQDDDFHFVIAKFGRKPRVLETIISLAEAHFKSGSTPFSPIGEHLVEGRFPNIITQEELMTLVARWLFKIKGKSAEEKQKLNYYLDCGLSPSPPLSIICFLIHFF